MSRPIQRVLFIEPRAPRPHIFSRVVIPRLGAVLLGTILKGQGLDVKVIVEEIDEPDYRRLDFQPDLVAISTITSTAPRAYALARFYRSQGIPVVLGGAHPSFLPAEGLEHADYVICGEGDEALPELVAALNDGGKLEGIGNLAYREGEAVRLNPWRPFVADLDALPIPDYGLIHGWEKTGNRYISIATSRGCPYNCSFCSVILLFGRKYRYNSVDRILEELRTHGTRAAHVFFCDDNFTARRERIKELCERILREGLKLEWSAQVRVEAAKDEELLRLMAKSGCYIVFVGLESINPATLKAYNKKQTVEGIREAVHTFHRHNIRVHGMFVFGAEEDDFQVIRDTVTFSREVKLDSLQYLILTPVPGTRVFQELEQAGRILCRDWSLYDGHHAVFQPRHFTPYELQYETVRAMRRFYSWPAIAGRLLQGDFLGAQLWTYARLLTRHAWKRASYPNQLKELLLARVRQLRQWLPSPRKVTKVGIPADIWSLSTWDHQAREFLVRFLERLGLEVVHETADEPGSGPVQALQREIARLQEKADLVLLPLWAGLEGARQRLKELQGLTQETTARLLTLEFQPATFYNACMELGLCFQKRLDRIRRIYFQTLAEVGAAL